MKNKELFRALDGLYAYDEGLVDSGIHDEALRQRVREYLERCANAEPDALYPAIVDEFLREYYYREPYTVETVLDFMGWLIQMMDWPGPPL